MHDYVTAPDFRIVHLLFGLATSFGRLYAYPSQDKLCGLLQWFYGRHMSRRTLNRHVGGLVRDGWISRLRRHRRSSSGELELHSTLYTFTRRAIRAFAALRSGLRFLGTGTRRARDDFRCASPGTKSVLIVQSHGVAPPSGPPSPRQKEAARDACAAMRKILAR